MQSILGDKRGPTRVYGGICKDVCELLQVETRNVEAMREANFEQKQEPEEKNIIRLIARKVKVKSLKRGWKRPAHQ